MSPKAVFGDNSSIRAARRFSRAYFGDSLEVVASKDRGAVALEAEDAAREKLRLATTEAVGDSQSRRGRAKRARINTIAPSNYNGDLRVIYHGLDALVVNVIGAVRPDFLLLMPMAQEDAKEVDGLALAPLPPFLGENLMMRAYGGGTFKFLMANDDVTVKVRKADHSSNIAAAQVEITAACLHRLGWRAAIVALREWVPLFAPHTVLQVSEVDLCADTQGWYPTAEDFFGSGGRAFVCPVGRAHLILYEDNHLGYVRFGTGGAAGSRSGQAPIQAVIYDKTDEIVEHDKGWFVPIWARSADYKPDEIVTRIEFRLRREYLKERRIDTLDDLLGELNALWSEGLEWCRYSVIPEAVYDEAGDVIPVNRSRLEVREEWRWLKGLSWGDGSRLPLERRERFRPSLDRTLAAWGGYLVTLQAMFGETLPIDMAGMADLAWRAALKRLDARGESYEQKVIDRHRKFGLMRAV